MTDTEAAVTVDWKRWMTGLGRHRRRLREFLGMSQEQLARLAGVSQGAISRLEAGRGLATPLLVVMKINVALKQALQHIDPEMLSDEARRLRDADDRISPAQAGGGFKDHPLFKEHDLEELVELYRDLPEGQRRTLLLVVRAVSSALKGQRADWSAVARGIPGLSD